MTPTKGSPYTAGLGTAKTPDKSVSPVLPVCGGWVSSMVPVGISLVAVASIEIFSRDPDSLQGRVTPHHTYSPHTSPSLPSHITLTSLTHHPHCPHTSPSLPSHIALTSFTYHPHSPPLSCLTCSMHLSSLSPPLPFPPHTVGGKDCHVR